MCIPTLPSAHHSLGTWRRHRMTNTTLAYNSLRLSTSNPYLVLSFVIKKFISLKRSTAVVKSPTSLARRIDKDSVNNCTAAVRSAVTVGSLPQRDVAALATAAVAASVWHGHQLIPMTFSAEMDCSDPLSLIHQPTSQ